MGGIKTDCIQQYREEESQKEEKVHRIQGLVSLSCKNDFSKRWMLFKYLVQSVIQSDLSEFKGKTLIKLWKNKEKEIIKRKEKKGEKKEKI